MSTPDYYDMTDKDLEAELVGKRIVKIDTDENTLTLHDGTVLIFEDSSECCAWFEAQLEEKNLTDNAITHVTEEECTSEDAPEAWVVHVFAADTNIVDVSIQGDPTSGYYCHSIDLKVVKVAE